MEVLLYMIPAFVVMITAYLLIDRMLTNDEKRRNYERAQKINSAVVPVRLRAYERITLVLERTSPENIIPTIIQPEMDCLEFQTKLIQGIRNEFEHNYAQQIYVGDELWMAFISTQENLIKMIHTVSGHFKADDPAIKLAEGIIKIYTETENNPTEIALGILKNEVRHQFIA